MLAFGGGASGGRREANRVHHLCAKTKSSCCINFCVDFIYLDTEKDFPEYIFVPKINALDKILNDINIASITWLVAIIQCIRYAKSLCMKVSKYKSTIGEILSFQF